MCLDMNKNVLIVANIVNAEKWITFQKCANLFTQMFTWVTFSRTTPLRSRVSEGKQQMDKLWTEWE